MPHRKTKRKKNLLTRELQFPIRSLVHRTKHKLKQLPNVNPRKHLALVCDINSKLYLRAARRAIPSLILVVALFASALGNPSMKIISATIWFVGPIFFCCLGHVIWMRSKAYIGDLPIDHRLILGANDCLLVTLCVASVLVGFVQLNA